MIRGTGAFAVLALRVALSTWLLLVALAALGGVAIDAVVRGDQGHGLAAAFLAGLIVLPPIALCWGLWCAWRQHKALAGTGAAAGLLSVGRRTSIHVELPSAQALQVAESTLRSVFVATRLQGTALGLAARVSDTGASNLLLPWRFQDNFALAVLPEGDARCVLEVAIDPVHVWLYGLFAVDGGRCAKRMQAYEATLLERIRACNTVSDDVQRQEASRARRSEAQLAMLRAHVEPHFIFNTLAHVRASLGEDVGQAAAMLDALVDFLRRNSLALTRDETTLREELAVVESYLRIIGLRLAERLSYDLACPPALLDRTVPAACLLVLVENAVKHGIERSAGGGRISLRCEATEGGGLVLSVNNDGPPFDVTGGRQGGLSNLHERLKLLYGVPRLLEIAHPASGVVQVSITLPPRAQT